MGRGQRRWADTLNVDSSMCILYGSSEWSAKEEGTGLEGTRDCEVNTSYACPCRPGFRPMTKLDWASHVNPSHEG